jgi:hypothetical protein
MWAEGRLAEAYAQLTHLINYMNEHGERWMLLACDVLA